MNSDNEGFNEKDQPVSTPPRRRRTALLLLCTTVLALAYFLLSPSLTFEEEVSKTSKSEEVIAFKNHNSYKASLDASTGEGKGKDEARTSTKAAKKPNILFIMTDQQRFDAIRRVQDELPYYKNVTKIRTPNLDKLSRDGVYFRNAYTQCSVCGPARASLRSGCTIERTGLQTNRLMETHAHFPWFDKRVQELTSIDEVLVQHGYNNEYYGKWHLPDRFWENVKYNNYDIAEERFTFEEKVIMEKYKRYLKIYERRGMISRTLQEGMQMSQSPYTPIEIDARYGLPTGTDLTAENGFASWQTRESNLAGEASLSKNYSHSHFIADASFRALKRLRQQDDPFFLTVSFVAPHPPMIASPEYLKYYKERKDKLFVSHSYQDTMENSAYKHIATREPKYQNYTILQEWTSVYYAMIEEIDDMIGHILKELGDDKGNTLIIFTSDHGEMLGAHGKREKNTFYEESNKVPLFMSFPGMIEEGTVVDELVSHLDVFATILDYSGLSDFDDSDGTSLRSKIEKKSYNADYDEDVVIAEWDFKDPLEITPDTELKGNAVFAIKNPLATDLSFMVRKGDYKLMLRKDATTPRIDMMFNLHEDPFEMNNLLGLNSGAAAVETREKAEHLRCLLLDWMHRMDGGDKHYYSDPIANGGEGSGDIEEVRLRQSWPALDFWKSDSRIEMGRPVWNGTHYVRNEYVYFGTRTPGRRSLKKIRLSGEDAVFFELDLFGSDILEDVSFDTNECKRLKVTFATTKLEIAPRKYRGSIKLQLLDGDDITEHVIAVRMNTNGDDK